MEFFSKYCLPDVPITWMPRGKVLRIKRLRMIRQYHGIQEETHGWLEDVIYNISHIKDDNIPTPEKICFLKFSNDTNATNWRAFKKSQRLEEFLKEQGYTLYYPGQISEKQKIYLLFHARQIVLSWGANSCINFEMIVANCRGR
jgi:hypothetical protein